MLFLFTFAVILAGCDEYAHTMERIVEAMAENSGEIDFSAFAPANVPEKYELTRNDTTETGMIMMWQSSFDYDALYETYTEWLRWGMWGGDESEFFPFEQISWRTPPTLRWNVSAITAADLERIVFARNKYKYDFSAHPLVPGPPGGRAHRPVPDYFLHDPVFLAEEFTSDIVRARVTSSPVTLIQISDSDIFRNRYFERTFRLMQFGVLFDGGVLVRVRAEGLTYEEVWAMFENIFEAQ